MSATWFSSVTSNANLGSDGTGRPRLSIVLRAHGMVYGPGCHTVSNACITAASASPAPRPCRRQPPSASAADAAGFAILPAILDPVRQNPHRAIDLINTISGVARVRAVFVNVGDLVQQRDQQRQLGLRRDGQTEALDSLARPRDGVRAGVPHGIKRMHHRCLRFARASAMSAIAAFGGCTMR